MKYKRTNSPNEEIQAHARRHAHLQVQKEGGKENDLDLDRARKQGERKGVNQIKPPEPPKFVVIWKWK